MTSGDLAVALTGTRHFSTDLYAVQLLLTILGTVCSDGHGLGVCRVAGNRLVRSTSSLTSLAVEDSEDLWILFLVLGN